VRAAGGAVRGVRRPLGLRPRHPLPSRRRGTPEAPHPTPYSLHPTPYTLHSAPYTLHPAPSTLHPTPYTLHPAPYTLHPTPYALHHTPYTPSPKRCTRNPKPETGATRPNLSTINPKPETPSPQPRPPSFKPQTQHPKSQPPGLIPETQSPEPYFGPTGGGRDRIHPETARKSGRYRVQHVAQCVQHERCWRWLFGNGEVPRGEKLLYSGTDPESNITEYTLVYEDTITSSLSRSGLTKVGTRVSYPFSTFKAGLKHTHACSTNSCCGRGGGVQSARGGGGVRCPTPCIPLRTRTGPKPKPLN